MFPTDNFWGQIFDGRSIVFQTWFPLFDRFSVLEIFGAARMNILTAAHSGENADLTTIGNR